MFSDAAITVGGISSISGIPDVAGLPSAVDLCDVPIVSAAVANVLVVSSCCCCWLLNVAVFSTVAEFPTVSFR